MEYERDVAVIIGRFQPLHNTHIALIRFALARASRVLILIGSPNSARTVKNPFTYEERERFIKMSFDQPELDRIQIDCVRDNWYNEEMWLAEVQNKVSTFNQFSDTGVELVGHYSDQSSYYLNNFPQWAFATPDFKIHKLHATEIREHLFGCPEDVQGAGWDDKGVHWDTHVPKPVVEWIEKSFIPTKEFTRLRNEFQHYKNYQEKWGPGPFITTDCMVVKSGHILLVRRKMTPGENLYALPGGFLLNNESIVQGALRELKEETGIRTSVYELRNCITDSQVFDYPYRSLRGRVITHVFRIDLGSGVLPEVRGGSDAKAALWTPVMNVTRHETEFFEDHAQIIQCLLQGSKRY